MNKKIIPITKIILGLLIVIGGFPQVVMSLLLVIGASIGGGTSNANSIGQVVGMFFGSLIVWIIGVWLLQSGNKQRKFLKLGVVEQK